MIKTVKLLDSFMKKEKDTYTFRFQLLDEGAPHQLEVTSVPRFIMTLNNVNVINKIVTIEDYENGIITFDLNHGLSDGTYECEVVVTTEAMVETFPTVGYQKFQIHKNLDDAITGETVLPTEFEILLERITTTEVAIGTKADLLHEHTSVDITDLSTLMDGKADLDHAHTTDEVIGLDDALNTIEAELDTKADINDLDDLETKVDTNNTELQNLITDNTNAIAVNAEDILENADAITTLEQKVDADKAELNARIDAEHEIATMQTITDAPITTIDADTQYLQLDNVQGKTLQNLAINERYRNTQSGNVTISGDYAKLDSFINDTSTFANVLSKFDSHLLKPNTLYTIFVLEISHTSGKMTLRDITNETNILDNFGLNNVTFRTNANPSTEYALYYNRMLVGEKAKIANNIIILEGDYTNRTIPPHFEGIQSATESENNELQIKTVGKNLLNPNIIEKGAFVGEKDVYAETENGNEVYRRFRMFLPKGTYTFSATSDVTIQILRIYYDNHVEFVGVPDSKTFTVAIDGLVGFSIRNVSSTNITNLTVQLEEGTTATAYEPYIEDTITVQLSEPLRSLPGGRIPDTGALSVACYDTIENGKIVRRIGKKVLNGTENWVKSETITEGKYRFVLLDFGNKVGREYSMCCDKYPFTGEDTYRVSGIISGASASYLFIRDDSKFTEVADLKAWLAENPMTVYYQLLEPIEEDIIPLNQLTTYKHVLIENAITPTITLSYGVNVGTKLNQLEQSVHENNEVLIDHDERLKVVEVVAANNEADIADNRQMLEQIENEVMTVDEFTTYWNTKKGW